MTARARTDLAEIAAYLFSEASEEVARRVVNDILARLDELREFPQAGAPRDHVRPGLRVVVKRRYASYYLVEPTEIVIIRVLHGSRDVAAISAARGDEFAARP